MMIRDSEVEVTSKVDGFKGSWYKAILVETPTKSGRKKLRIRYLNLLKEEGSSSPLTENVDQSLIRPVPPENLYKDVVLEQGLVVDAYDKDGWWTGLIIKKIEDENKFLVYFDSQPDIIGYETSQLRAHVHWTGCKWLGPETKELDKSMFSPGTMVEVSSVINRVEVVWFPAMLIKEIEEDNEKKYIVKEFKKGFSYNGDEERENETVDAIRVRPKPPPFSCEEYELSDNVEAFRDGLGWRQGLVMATLSDKRYIVTLKATTEEEYVYKHSDLRPFKVWKDGVWLDEPKQNPVKESASHGIEKNLMHSSVGVKTITPETVVATGELRKKMVLTPQVAPLESVSPVTPALPVAAMLRQTNAETERQKMLSEGEGNSKDKGKKRKREEEHNSWLKEIRLSSDQSSNAEVILPFTKTSPFWKTLETKEEYKTEEKHPHFSPLWEVEEDIRECCAIGMMVTYYELSKEVKDLLLDVSSSKISSLISSCAELEKHGFDVAISRSWIYKVLAIKHKLAKKEEERNGFEKKIEDEKREMRKLEEEIVELKRQEMVAKEKKRAAEKRIAEMKASSENILKEFGKVEIEYLGQWYQLYGDQK